MNVAHVERMVLEVTDEFPDSITLALLDVNVVVVDGQVRGKEDAKGLFVGDTLNDFSSEEEEEPQGAKGCIYLFAPNLTDKEEATRVFLHEVGHALGLDEADVEELGLG